VPVKITINKSIPTGAGLGGGSSNAAYALSGIDQYLKLNTPIKYLMQIASTIGSDTPFFLGEQNSAFGSGRGEILDYFNITLPYSILLVYPGIHISTPEAYSSLNRKASYHSESDFQSIINDSLEKPESLLKLRNDFEEPVFKSYPILFDIKEQLYHDKARFALMSGSGSTIFGLFESIDDAKNAQSNLSNFKSQICNSI
jgi:4-diphosphocytidyl-2-C-methyl-D-erythritol kinase